MRFKKAILIQIFIYTDEELKMQDIGISDDNDGLKELETRAFWCIDSANRFKEDHKMTAFFVNGDSYVTPMDIQDFIKKIDKHLE